MFGATFSIYHSAPGESVAAFFQFKVEKAGGWIRAGSKHISIAYTRGEQVCVSIEAEKEREDGGDCEISKHARVEQVRAMRCERPSRTPDAHNGC